MLPKQSPIEESKERLCWRKERITRTGRESLQHPHQRSCSRPCYNKVNSERHVEEYRHKRVESCRRQKEQAAKH